MKSFTMRMPDLGEGVVEAELVEWRVGEGERVTTETPLAEVMTDKSTVELMAPALGVVRRLLVAAGAVVAVGEAIVEIEADAASTEAERPAAALPRRARAAPTVRRRARELGLDLDRVPGTGPDGRVLIGDVERAVQAAPERASAEGPERSIRPLRGLRRVIAGRMEKAWREIPHITYVEEVDAHAVEGLREALNGEREAGRTRLTLLPWIARALVLACREQPHFNATFDGEARTLEVHGAVHLGIATQTERGLVVPVVRDADRLGLFALAEAIADVAQAAREDRLGPEALRGSTLTITSLGRLGGIATTPILNHPEVAVIGVNKIAIRPVWMDGGFVPRPIMNLSSSFDHRIIDGHDAATFVQHVKRLLEEPALLTLGWTR